MDAAGYDPRFRKWHFEDLPILPEPFRYVLAPGKEAAFENLRVLMHRPDVDTIINACDAGREGELIFRLVYEIAGCCKPVRRLWISSMEDNAIRDGFSDLRPGADYEALYQSALCRQKADWLVGINATRLFSVLYHRTLNVGRVLTPTLAMLVERERKISQFKKEKYYVLRLEMNGTEAVSEKLNDSTEVERAAAACKGVPAICTSVTKEQKKEQPPKLYDLTTLQREANRLLGYTAKQTLDYAQSLYEKKLLTYPRTDSRYLTSDMAETASCVIHLAAKLPPFDSCSNFFPLVEAMISDKDVSDHHAIIPTMELEKADVHALPVGERNLLLLVCCKLLCAAAEPYMYKAVTATFDCGRQSFTAKGKQILSYGWQEIDRVFRVSLKETSVDEDGSTFPDFTEGRILDNAVLLLVAIFIVEGTTMLSQKCFAAFIPESDPSMFSLLAFAIAAIMTSVTYFILRFHTPRTQPAGGLWRLSAYGVVQSVALLAIMMLSTLTASLIPAVIQFSLQAGGSLIVSVMVSALAFHQTPTRKNRIGIALCIVALIIVNSF